MPLIERGSRQRSLQRVVAALQHRLELRGAYAIELDPAALVRCERGATANDMQRRAFLRAGFRQQ